MTQVNLSDYKSIYLQTAKEYVNKMLVSLDKLSGNALDKEAVSDIHIGSHSLKSQSQVMGFTSMANLCAIIEKIAGAILDHSCKVNADLTSLLKQAVDELGLCLRQIETEGKEKDLSIFVKKLEIASGTV